MKTYDRQQAILQILQERGSVNVAELAVELGASQGTIRNDLATLEEQKRLTRVRGGAILFNGNAVRPIFNSRIQINAEAKKKIARWASELVSDGDVILLDASSTIYHMATHLEDRHNITVVTNHLETARLLNSDPTKRIILLGGYLHPDGLSVTGEIGQEVLKNLHLNTAFISCAGFSMEAGLMEADIQEANLKRQILLSAARVVALVDSSKFDKVGLKSFATVDQISHLVTDDRIAPDTVERLRESHVALTICGESWVQSLRPQGDTRKHYRIGFANLSEALPFSIDVRRGLERAAKATDRLDIVYVDNNLDGETAIRLADELIDQGIDLVIEYQIDELAGNVIMNKFKQHQIPVIAVDIPMVGATYFGVDNFTAGNMAGEALGKWIETHWQGQVDYIIVLEEKRAGSLPGARIQGQLHGLTRVIGQISQEQLLYLDSGNSAETSYHNVCPALRQVPEHSRIAFVCFNDDAAIGALQALRELDIEENVAMVGQGADRRIRSEIRDPKSAIIGSTAFMPEQYGERLIELALQLLDGAPLPPAVYMAHKFIDRTNIDAFYPE
jgi:ribose transport system substrate-binding protein